MSMLMLLSNIILYTVSSLTCITDYSGPHSLSTLIYNQTEFTKTVYCFYLSSKAHCFLYLVQHGGSPMGVGI